MNLDPYRDTSDDNDSQTSNQDVGIMDASGINLKTSDDDLQTELIYQKENESDVSNQSFIEDAPITMLVKILPQRHTRGIPKPAYEPELFK
jgi:hypothetical protein